MQKGAYLVVENYEVKSFGLEFTDEILKTIDKRRDATNHHVIRELNNLIYVELW